MALLSFIIEAAVCVGGGGGGDICVDLLGLGFVLSSSAATETTNILRL